jgi:hypothetical protein
MNTQIGSKSRLRLKLMISLVFGLSIVGEAKATHIHVQKPTSLKFITASLLHGADEGAAFTIQVLDGKGDPIKSQPSIALNETVNNWKYTLTLSGGSAAAIPLGTYSSPPPANMGTDANGYIVDTPVSLPAGITVDRDSSSHSGILYDKVKITITPHQYWLYDPYNGNTGYLLNQNQTITGTITWTTGSVTVGGVTGTTSSCTVTASAVTAVAP